MLVVSVIFIVLGILIKYGKMYFLIAGYNTMTQEEKAKYDIEGIATVFRNAMFGMAALLVMAHFTAKQLAQPYIEIVTMFVVIIIGVAYLLIASNSSKYKVDNDETEIKN